MATFEKSANNEVKYTVTIPADEFDKGMQDAYVKNRKRYAIPGFRKGKAPRPMIERHFGEGVFYEDTFDALYWKAYSEAVNESGEIPVDSPQLDIEQIGKGQDLIFSATVAVRPSIHLESAQYRGIEVERVEYTVSDADVERQVDRERERLARYVEVERPIETGDQVNLDYVGTIDGVAFPGGTAEDQTLVIGSGRFIPGFEEQMVGLVTGEEKDLNVSFPAEYHAEELAGKEAVFHVLVRGIKVKELPETDDEFAKDVSDFDSLDEYKADIRKNLEEEAAKQTDSVRRQRCVDALVKAVPFDLPEAMVQRQIDYMMNDMRYRLSAQGISLEDYFAYMGLDVQSARETMRGDAEQKVRADILLEAVVETEAIEPSEEDVEHEIEALSKSISKTVDETKAMLKESDYRAIKSDLGVKLALNGIVEAAIWVDPKPAAAKE